MRRSLMILALLIFLAPLPARAQAPLRLEVVRVQVWPEFDRPAALIITRLTLPPDTTLPLTLDLRIPARAEVNAVAVQTPGVGLADAYYEQKAGEEWTTLSIRATSLEVWVEYYIALAMEGTTRRVEYRWPGDLAVEAFSVAFQAPVGADNISTDPPPARSEFDSYNLQNFITETVSLEAGEPFTFTARYEKADDVLSASTIPVEPARPLEQTGGQMSWGDVLPWVLGGLGLGLIVLGMFVLFGFLKGENARSIGLARRKRSRTVRLPRPEAGEETATYCHACGNRAQPGDQFCRTCGSRLRREE